MSQCSIPNLGAPGLTLILLGTDRELAAALADQCGATGLVVWIPEANAQASGDGDGVPSSTLLDGVKRGALPRPAASLATGKESSSPEEGVAPARVQLPYERLQALWTDLPVLSHAVDDVVCTSAAGLSGAAVAEIRRVLAPRGMLHVVLDEAGLVVGRTVRRILLEEGLRVGDLTPSAPRGTIVLSARVP